MLAVKGIRQEVGERPGTLDGGTPEGDRSRLSLRLWLWMLCSSRSSSSRDTLAMHLASKMPRDHGGDWVDAGLTRTKTRPMAQTQRPRNGTHRQGHIWWLRLLMLEGAVERRQAGGGPQTASIRQRGGGLRSYIPG
jgi:hypothetical protein